MLANTFRLSVSPVAFDTTIYLGRESRGASARTMAPSDSGHLEKDMIVYANLQSAPPRLPLLELLIAWKTS